MTATVPSTGSSATQPGNSVAWSKRSPAATMAATPAHASGARHQAGRHAPPASSASIAPAANSHTRVGVTKYACDWSR